MIKHFNIALKHRLQILLGICSLWVFNTHAQHNNNWAIGFKKGITFNTVPPSLINTAIANDSDLTNSSWAENSSSYSDCNGNLILYGSGYQLWNKNHKTLKNGYFSKGMLGGSNTFMAPIIPMPNSSRYLYYFYQTGCFYNGCGNNQITYYAIIDMNADNGLGAVVKKDMVLDSGAGNNCIAYTAHKNGKDIWLIHGVNNTRANAFLLTDTGIVRTPIISYGIYSGKVDFYSNSIYNNISNGFRQYSHFKITHDGKNLISTGIDSSTTKLGCSFMYDFDNGTGKLTNAKVLLKFSDIFYTNYFANFFYTEVAPNDSNIFFLSTGVINTSNPNINIRKIEIYQVNRYTLKKYFVKQINNRYAFGLQIGPNGKIYTLVNYDYPFQLCYIDKPNLQGINSNFKVLLADTNILTTGFPTVYQPYYKLYYTSNNDNNPCQDTSVFNIFVDTNFRQLTVFYGDGDSVRLISPLKPSYTLKHHYKQTGNYYFNLKALNPTCNSYSRTGDSIFVALIPKRYAISKTNSVACGQSTVYLKDSFVNTTQAYYSWQNGGADTTVLGTTPANGYVNHLFLQNNNPIKGTWQVTIRNNECPNFLTVKDSINLSYLPKPIIQYSITGYQTQGIKNNKPLYSLCEQTKLTFKDTSPQLTKGSLQLDNITNHYTKNLVLNKTLAYGNYTAVINDTNTYGCANTDTFYISTWQTPKPNVLIPNAQQCIKGNVFTVKNNSTLISDSVLYQWFWNNNDSIELTLNKNRNYQYKNSGSFSVKLKATSIHQCFAEKDTVIKVYPYANAEFMVNKDTLCGNKKDSFVMKLKNPILTNCYWQFGDLKTATSNGLIDVKHNYNAIGKYTVTNITSTTNNCKDTFSKNLETVPSPIADFTLTDTAQCLLGNSFNIINVNAQPNNSFKTIYWGNGDDDNNVSNGSINHSYTNIGKYKIQLEVDLNRCKDTFTKTIEIYAHPNTAINLQGFCMGDSSFYTYNVLNNVNIAQQVWAINSEVKSTQKTFKQFNSQSGVYNIRLKTKSDKQCENIENKNITIVEKPKADFTYTRLGRNSNGIELYFLNKSENSNLWHWQFDNGDTALSKNPKYTYLDTGFRKVTLIANNQNICFDTLQQLVPILDDIIFYFPNVFTPNENGLNDGFGLNSNQHLLVRDYKVEVFTRWGGKVFETNQVSEYWIPSNGTIGIYIYKAQIRDVYNVLHDYKGVIEVLR